MTEKKLKQARSRAHTGRCTESDMLRLQKSPMGDDKMLGQALARDYESFVPEEFAELDKRDMKTLMAGAYMLGAGLGGLVFIVGWMCGL